MAPLNPHTFRDVSSKTKHRQIHTNSLVPCFCEYELTFGCIMQNAIAVIHPDLQFVSLTALLPSLLCQISTHLSLSPPVLRRFPFLLMLSLTPKSCHSSLAFFTPGLCLPLSASLEGASVSLSASEQAAVRRWTFPGGSLSVFVSEDEWE